MQKMVRLQARFFSTKAELIDDEHSSEALNGSKISAEVVPPFSG
jgi:hypothetical protein